MQTPETCSLEMFECVAELRVSPFYLSYPKVYQKHLIPNNLFGQFNSRWASKHFSPPSVKMYLLKGVYVSAQGLVFTRDGSLISETKTQHSSVEILAAFEELTNLLACSSPAAHHQKGILCKKRAAENYGHWLVEMLPKAFLATRELQLCDDWPAVVFQTTGPMSSVISQSLDTIGFSAERIIVTDRSPCYFEELLVVDSLTHHSVYMSPLVFECMEFIAGKAPPSPVESLYVTRSSAKTRNFENEEEVRSFFFKRGYEEIECGQLSFLDQVSAFKSARRLAGPMGAAFSNAVFCSPNTELLMFMPASAQEYFFWHISEGKKLDYHEVRCAESGPQRGALPWNRDIYISEKTLEALTQHFDDADRIEQDLLEADGELPLLIERIKHTNWALSFSHSPDQTHEIYFAADGTIGMYRHENERFWRVRNGQLEILNRFGALSWKFFQAKQSNSTLKLHGVFSGMSSFSALLVEVQDENEKENC